MSDLFNNSIQSSTLGERLTTIKNLYVPPGASQVLALGFGAEVEPLAISNYGKSLLNVSSLNGLINLINQQDSKMEVIDTGTGEISVIVDNQLVAKWSSGNLTFQPNKILYVDTIMSAGGSVNFFSNVKPVIPTLNFGTNAERWNNIFASTIDTNVLISTGAGDINVNSNLICNGGLYINNGILPYTGGIPTPQDIGSDVLRFQNIYSNNSHTDRSYLNRIISPSHTSGSLVFEDSQYLSTIKFQENDVDINYKNLVLKASGSGELSLSNNNLTYMRNFYNPAYVLPSPALPGADCNRMLNLETGHILPLASVAFSIGAPTLRYTDIYSQNPPNHNSDKNLKTDIKTIYEFGLDFINKLHPVSYKWKDGGVREHWGFIAQELRDVLGHEDNRNNYGLYTYSPETEIEIETKNDDGTIEIETKIIPENYGVRYSELISPIVKSIQELSDKVYNLENNTHVQGDTIVMNSTPVQQSSYSSSSSNIKLEKKIDELVGRVFSLEHKTEEDESESDFSMLNNLQTRTHQLELQIQKQDKVIKKLTASLNKIIKNM